MSGVERGPLPGDHFTVVSNAWLRDPSLSWKAKGLLAYLASHREGYRVSQNQMLREATDGRDSLLSGLSELESAGYLSRQTGDRESGRYTADDYRLTDPARPTKSDSNRSGDPTSSGNPHGLTPHGSPEHENTNGEQQVIPTGSQGETPLTRHLAPVDDDPKAAKEHRKEQLGKIAAMLAREHLDAMRGIGNYLAVLGIVKKTLNATSRGGTVVDTGQQPAYSVEQIRQALTYLREYGRPVTGPTMLAALESPRTVTGARYGPRAPIPADADAHRGAF